jgi:PAS domain-containing protein
MDLDALRDHLRAALGGRPVVLTGGSLAGMARTAGILPELGVSRVFLLALGVGTGPLPTLAEAARHVLELRASDTVAEIRAAERLLADPPDDAVAALDAWDPERAALVIGTPYNQLTEIAGRRVYGPRRAEWAELEDKTTIDALWDELRVPRAPYEIVAATDAELAAAHDRLRRGAGTVWAGDASEGFNGGAVATRWVRTPGHAAEAAAYLAAHCRRARVMPFLEGVPCSIHGLVMPDGTATFRPVEMVTLRRPGSGRLLFAGVGTFWDPPALDRSEMRMIAAAVGEALRERVGYRGGFTIDGILTVDGFIPTELNPRFGAGFGVLGHDLDGLPFQLLHHAIVEDEPIGAGATELEAAVVASADRSRAGGGSTSTEVRADITREHPLIFEDGAWRRAGLDEPATGILSFGPSAAGGMVRLLLDPGLTPAGPPIAPLVAAAFAWSDQELGTGLGPLEAARPVR